jgi:hypothetical protein
MNVFEVEATYTDPSGALVAMGAAKLADGSAEVLEPLGGAAQIRARVSQGTAAAKLATGVYRGFHLSLLEGGDGTIRIARVALVDTPQLAKSSEGALLKLSRGPIAMPNDVLLNHREIRFQVR